MPLVQNTNLSIPLEFPLRIHTVKVYLLLIIFSEMLGIFSSDNVYTST